MKDVIVTIQLSKPVGKLGFGIPLILKGKAEAAVAYTECSSLAEVVTAGFAADTAEYKTAQLIFMQNDAPAKVAVCATTDSVAAFLASAENLNKSWRHLIVTSFETEGESTKQAVAEAIEATEDKMLYLNLETKDTTTLTGGMDRTVAFYCNSNKTEGEAAAVPVAALVGASAGQKVGAFTYKNLILKGITPCDLTTAEIEAIHAKGGITFVTKAGDNVTSEGKVLSGEYIDIVDSQDYVIQQLEYQTQKLLNQNKKIPYDNSGISMLSTVAVNVLQDAFQNGIIAAGEGGKGLYSVDYALREETDPADRAVRKYVGGKFSFVLAGAIHNVEIQGEIQI